MSLRALLCFGVVGALLAFLFVPIAIVVLFSFNAGSSTSFPLDGLSLRWYESAFTNDQFTKALGNSVAVAGLTALFTTVVGANAAFALSRRRSRWVTSLSLCITAPLALPGLFLGIALLSFYNELGIELSLLTIAIGHSLVTMPFVFLIIHARLARLDPAITEAARDLGAGSWTAFRLVTFPLVRPAFAGSVLIAVAWSFDEFIVTLFTAGDNQTLPIAIWTSVRRSLDPSINALATIIFATTILATILASRLLSRRDLTS
jgi:ABC-type spermidine/putrescine transport system permease subunit II